MFQHETFHGLRIETWLQEATQRNFDTVAENGYGAILG
jgi:hypothetical protein